MHSLPDGILVLIYTYPSHTGNQGCADLLESFHVEDFNSFMIGPCCKNSFPSLYYMLDNNKLGFKICAFCRFFAARMTLLQIAL